MDVGDHDGFDVSDRPTRCGQPGVQRGPGLVRVPTGVDDGHPASLELEGVDEDVTKRVVGDGNGNGPQARSYLFDGGQDVVIPRLFLCCTGDHDHRGARYTARDP